MSPAQKPTRPVDIYIRVSAVRGRGDDLLSTEIQEERCRAQLTALGLKAGEVFTDLDVSGTKESRPAFDQLKDRVATGESGGVIVYKLSRFGRNVKQVLSDVKWVESRGALFVCVDPTIDTSTPTGRFVLTVFAALDEMEAGNIGVAWRLAKAKAVENGIHITRHVPPGYARGDNRRLVLHPAHAPAVREAFAMAARGGSYSAVASHLTDTGVPSGDNAAAVWQPNRIKRLLANRAYLGEARDGHGVVNAEAHPPLVDELVWNLAQRKQTGVTLTRSVDNLLAGICRCASCSFAMRSQAARGATVGVYRCTTNTTHGRCPAPTTISQKRLEAYVIDRFLGRAGDVQLVPSTDDEGERIGGAIVEAERSYRSALTDLELRKQIGDADHSRLVSDAHRRWQELLAAAPAPPSRPMLEGVDLAELVDRLRREGNVNDLRELLGSAIAAVFVRPAASRAKGLPVEDRVRIVFHGDEDAPELPRRGERFEPRSYAW